jgi:hypothetical protein
MGEFFRGWRRKAGCVTLVMACVLMAGWVRSVAYVDVISYMRERSWMRLESIEQIIVLSIARSDRTFDRLFQAYSEQFANHVEALNSSILLELEPQLEENGCFFVARESHAKQWYGFCRGVVLTSSTRRVIWTIPYYSIVLPLTAISAWLLITNPRKPAQKPPEPKATIGA